MTEERSGELSAQEMDLRQIQLYARDLQQLYWQERKLRSDLAEEKLVLEYKVRELEALNQLFQTDLKEKHELRDAHQHLLEELRGMVDAGPGTDLMPRLKVLLEWAAANTREG